MQSRLFCVLGWHLDCMVPPLENPPDGRWHCPHCPPFSLTVDGANKVPGASTSTPRRDPSVASSSRSAIDEQAHPSKPSPKKRSRKPKNPPKAAVASEGSDHQPEEDELPQIVSVPRRRGRPPKYPKAHEDTPVLESPTKKRKRPPSPTPPSESVPRVRLRLPQRAAKGKEREEEDPPRGVFEDVLTTEERDTTKTTISNWDKQYFNRSRQAAEVSSFLDFVPIC